MAIEQQFIERVPQLVRNSLFSRPDKARKSQRELMDGILHSPSYDPAFIAFAGIQRAIREAKSPKALTGATSFLSEFLLKVNVQDEPKALHCIPSIVQAGEQVIRDEPQTRKNIPITITDQYDFMLKTAQRVLEANSRGVGGVEVRYIDKLRETVSGSQNRILDGELRVMNDWSLATVALISGDKDEFFEGIKGEPRYTIFQRKRLFERRYQNLSLGEMERTPFPPEEEDLDKMTAYLADLISSPDLTLNDKEIISHLFFDQSVFFDDAKGVHTFKNHNLFSNISTWQEHFLRSVIVTDDAKERSKIQTILNGISESARVSVIQSLLRWVINPVYGDPQFSGDNYNQRVSYHPFLVAAVTEYQKNHPEEKFMFSDEVGVVYFQSHILPVFVFRLQEMGLYERFREAVKLVESALESRSFSDSHFEALEAIFERNSGGEFLARFDRQTDELDQVREKAWEEIFEAGMHFMPMSQGENIIEFTDGSTPEIIGLKDIKVRTSGSLNDWRTNVAFTWQNSTIFEHGYLDNKGKLILRVPLENKYPGLYRMLNLLAVLTFHDLVLQERKEEELQNKESRLVSVSNKDSTRNFARTFATEVISHRGSLPRVQKDTDLIEDVYEKTGFKPRRVEMHDPYVRGAKEYGRIAYAYGEAVLAGAGSEVLDYLRAQLEEARTNAYQASAEKRRTVPDRFKLLTIKDPITGEERYLKTWVIEHTSPKPTEEERESPVKLYERYYRHSSALSYLEQLKPWFIGV